MASFDEVVARAQKATTSVSFYAYYDPVAYDMLLDETAARREQPLDIYWWINDLRGMSGPADGDGDGDGGGVPTEAELTQALPRTKLYWNRATPEAHGTLYPCVVPGFDKHAALGSASAGHSFALSSAA